MHVILSDYTAVSVQCKSYLFHIQYEYNFIHMNVALK